MRIFQTNCFFIQGIALQAGGQAVREWVYGRWREVRNIVLIKKTEINCKIGFKKLLASDVEPFGKRYFNWENKKQYENTIFIVQKQLMLICTISLYPTESYMILSKLIWNPCYLNSIAEIFICTKFDIAFVSTK